MDSPSSLPARAPGPTPPAPAYPVRVRTPITYVLFLLTALLFPFSTGVSSGLVFSPGIAFMALLAFSLLLRSNRLNVRDTYTVIMVVWGLVTAGVAMVFSGYALNPMPGAWRALAQVLGALVFAALCLGSIRWSHPYLIARGLIAYGVMTSLYYILNFFSVAAREGLGVAVIERAGAAALPWGGSNVIAASLYLCMVAAAVSYLVWRRKFDLLAVGMMISAILMTFSRTSGVLSSIFFVLFILMVGRWPAFVVPPALGYVWYRFYAYVNSEASSDLDYLIKDRLNTTGLTTLNTRTLIWERFRAHFADYPLYPVGYFGTTEAFGVTGHSLYITTLVEQGPLGVILQLGFLALLLLYTLRFPIWRAWGFRPAFMMLVGAILGFGILFVEDPYFTHQYVFVFWIFAAFLVRMHPAVVPDEAAQTRAYWETVGWNARRRRSRLRSASSTK